MSVKQRNKAWLPAVGNPLKPRMTLERRVQGREIKLVVLGNDRLLKPKAVMRWIPKRKSQEAGPQYSDKQGLGEGIVTGSFSVVEVSQWWKCLQDF